MDVTYEQSGKEEVGVKKKIDAVDRFGYRSLTHQRKRLEIGTWAKFSAASPPKEMSSTKGYQNGINRE